MERASRPGDGVPCHCSPWPSSPQNELSPLPPPPLPQRFGPLSCAFQILFSWNALASQTSLMKHQQMSLESIWSVNAGIDRNREAFKCWRSCPLCGAPPYVQAVPSPPQARWSCIVQVPPHGSCQGLFSKRNANMLRHPLKSQCFSSSLSNRFPKAGVKELWLGQIQPPPYFCMASKLRMVFIFFKY